MARDYTSLLQRIEAIYPSSVGGANQDDTLRAVLAQFANDTLAEIDRNNRWSLSYAEPSFVTVQGTQSYALPFPSPTAGSGLTTQTFIGRVYYEDTNGRIHILRWYNKEELQRVYGDNVSTTINQGSPTHYAVEPVTNLAGTVNFGSPAMKLSLYPVPDANGPDSGNYTIRMGGFFSIPPIIEISAATTATSVTLTVPSTAYLTALGVPADGTGYSLTLSIRGAGNLTIGAVADSHITTWSAFASATTITMSAAAITTVAAGAQCFLNSTNWIISHWPKLLEFGMLREVASYYNKTQDELKWDGRFKEQLENLHSYEYDRNRSNEQVAVAQPGQLASSLRRLEGFSTIDVRGDSN